MWQPSCRSRMQHQWPQQGAMKALRQQTNVMQCNSTHLGVADRERVCVQPRVGIKLEDGPGEEARAVCLEPVLPHRPWRDGF